MLKGWVSKKVSCFFSNSTKATFSDEFDFLSLKLFTLSQAGGFFHYNRIFLIFLATKPKLQACFSLLRWPFIPTISWNEKPCLNPHKNEQRTELCNQKYFLNINFLNINFCRVIPPWLTLLLCKNASLKDQLS